MDFSLNPDFMSEAVKAVAPGKDSIVCMDYRAPTMPEGTADPENATYHPVVFSSKGSPVEAILMPLNDLDEKKKGGE